MSLTVRVTFHLFGAGSEDYRQVHERLAEMRIPNFDPSTRRAWEPAGEFKGEYTGSDTIGFSVLIADKVEAEIAACGFRASCYVTVG